MIQLIPGVRTVLKAMFTVEHVNLEREVFGLKFKNPVGLAAGFDKNAAMIDDLATLGFGFIEIGTLTPKGQQGNDQPRLFRLPKDESLINRMGFNNEGVGPAIQRLAKVRSDIIIGGNIGKNKDTPLEEAVGDYVACFHALFDYVDYFAVNVSSPNTPNLRELQDKAPLKQLLTTLQGLNREKPSAKPILLKIAPDLTVEQLDDIIEISLELNLSGVIATNTTIERGQLQTLPERLDQIGNGGLSGRSVKRRSDEVIAYLHKYLKGKVPIIGVGGIFSAQDAMDKLNSGATLVQVYTGLIYEGPGMVRDINRKLSDVTF